MRRLALALLLLAAPALADTDKISLANLPTCTAGDPISLWVLDSVDADTCDPEQVGSSDAHCCCANGTWAACAGAGGGGSGDIEAVWGCTSGDCSALTAASGDSLDAGNANASSPATRSTSLPGTCSEGQLHQDTDSGGTETFVCIATNTWVKLAGVTSSSGGRLPSALNPPESPNAINCEFDSGVCAGWTLDGGYSSGTIDPHAQVTGGDIYDCSTWPGWCLFQDYTNTTPTYKAAVYRSHTPAAQETWWFHVMSAGGVSASHEGRAGLCYFNTGDSNEEVCFGYHSPSGSEQINLYASNNGSVTSECLFTVTAGPGQFDVVMVLWRNGNTYSAGLVTPFGGGGFRQSTTDVHFLMCDTVTKTGVTTFDQIAFVIGDANNDPTPPIGVDFIRYTNSISFAHINP